MWGWGWGWRWEVGGCGVRRAVYLVFVHQLTMVIVTSEKPVVLGIIPNQLNLVMMSMDRIPGAVGQLHQTS